MTNVSLPCKPGRCSVRGPEDAPKQQPSLNPRGSLCASAGALASGSRRVPGEPCVSRQETSNSISRPAGRDKCPHQSVSFGGLNKTRWPCIFVGSPDSSRVCLISHLHPFHELIRGCCCYKVQTQRPDPWVRAPVLPGYFCAAVGKSPVVW